MKLLFPLLAAPSLLLADITQEKQYPDAPTIAGFKYSVHDTTRPQPIKVAGAQVVTTPPPADAVVLFNGESSEAFEGNWKVKDGILIASGPNNAVSKEQFADCQLHIEWRIPAGREVSGQTGGNSGLFLMDLYEIQVQESHTNVTYPDGQAGSIYGQFPPLVNPSLPQGEWQSYDIAFKAPVYEGGKVVQPARITVLHNGVVVQNAQEILGPTVHRAVPAYPTEHPKKGPLRLQWHSDPIEFRNIWVRDLEARK